MTPFSRAKRLYTQDALVLLSQTIKLRRLERRMTMAAVAELAGVSRGLVRKIESGDPGCSIGAVFIVAAVVGVALFDLETTMLSTMLVSNKRALTLLPKSARHPNRPVFDDF
jgi:transcriptional regulator with XRE-family HTH domain